MPVGPWSQWAVSYAKDALGGSTLGLLVKFSGVLHRQLVRISGPLLFPDCLLQRLKQITGTSIRSTIFLHGSLISMAVFQALVIKLHHTEACWYVPACMQICLGLLGKLCSLAIVICARVCMLMQVKDKEGTVISELEDRRSQLWLFVRGPLPDKLPVRELDAPWQLFSLQ